MQKLFTAFVMLEPAVTSSKTTFAVLYQEAATI
jgi:hypothetical protein